ncbi:MAG: M48 family metalloprotease [Candidatus Eremiobacteraeota bacterium]|nr:M48 family metalloprotease [Candidatus Eremiobacteraeota bacterium]
MREYFRGKTSLRTRGEWLSLWLTLLLGPLVLSFAGAFIHESAGVSTVILLAVLAMIYVTLARGQLLGSSVLIHKAHFPEVFEVVERCAQMIGIPVPLVFVRDDQVTPVVALGFGEPYSLVISSHWLKHFEADELKFMIGRELGNIAAGHTRITSLLSVNGRENAIISIVFGAWLRRTEYTADRFGMLCAANLDAAYRAIMIATFHHFGREIDIEAFARQRDAFGSDSVLNMGEWLSSQPFATNRMERLRQFRASALYAYWEDVFAKQPVALAAFTPVPRTGRVMRADCAGFGRRIGVLLIDCFVVWSIFTLTPSAAERVSRAQDKIAAVSIDEKVRDRPAQTTAVGTKSGTATPKTVNAGTREWTWTNPLMRFFGAVTTAQDGNTLVNLTFAGFPQEFMIYSFVLIALGGQTLGMMVLAVKVTTPRFGRPPIWTALWRALVSPLGILTFVLGPFARIELHDRLSGTRVVPLERTFERAPAAS